MSLLSECKTARRFRAEPNLSEPAEHAEAAEETNRRNRRLTLSFSLPTGYRLLGHPRLLVTDARTVQVELLPCYLGAREQAHYGGTESRRGTSATELPSGGASSAGGEPGSRPSFGRRTGS
jgi:hypothetical protein